MKLRFAFGTVTYGRRISCLHQVLADIADAGYEGVEICQAPGMIAGMQSHAEVREVADRFGLKVLGYIGGTLDRRMKFCEDGDFDGYFVIDDWDVAGCESAMKAGFRLAYHPHVLHSLALVDDTWEQLLSKYPKLLLLPDTGHMGINAEDMTNLVDDARCFGRLAAVHLKDWEPQFGRHSHRYARGFVDLGKGDLRDEIFTLLQKLEGATSSARKELWTVTEVDSSRSTVRASVFACADWLRKQNIGMPAAKAHLESLPLSIPAKNTEPKVADTPWKAEDEVRFCHEILQAAGRSAVGFYQEIALAFGRLLPCIATEVRVYTPQLQGLELAGWSGPEDWNPSDFIPVNPEPTAEGASNTSTKGRNLSHRAVLAQRCLVWSLPHSDFQRPEFVVKHGLTQMYALPVVNSWNAHHVRFLINLFPKVKLGEEHDPHFERLAEVISRAADLMLDDRCLLAAGEMQYEKAAYLSSDEFFRSLIAKVKQTIDGEAVAIFRVARSRNRLEEAASTGTQWRADLKPTEKHYLKGDGSHTGAVWQTNRIFYKRYPKHDFPNRARSSEKVTHEDQDDCLMVPIARRGKRKPVLGIVRCRNRDPKTTLGPKMFTDDDAAALDALLQAALPQLELLLDQEFRQQSLGRLLHEFNVPNNAIRHCVRRMEHDLRRAGQDTQKVFRQDYLGDVWDYTQLIGSQLQNADLYGGEVREIQPSFELTDLFAEVIAPAVNHVGGLLKLKKLPPNAIYYGSLVGFPPLWADRMQLQQVFFNLLSNAIKYGGGPGVFRVQIDSGIDEGRLFILRFSDFGPGIREEDRENIFLPGWRSADAKENNIYGHGLGLAIVRDIIRAHGGDIILSNCAKPTRFTISLPYSLAYGAPERHNRT